MLILITSGHQQGPGYLSGADIDLHFRLPKAYITEIEQEHTRILLILIIIIRFWADVMALLAYHPA